MSDWDIVKEYIINKGYKPTITDMDGLISVILLSWDNQNEDEEEGWSLEDYLREIVGNDLQSYDYE